MMVSYALSSMPLGFVNAFETRQPIRAAAQLKSELGKIDNQYRPLALPPLASSPNNRVDFFKLYMKGDDCSPISSALDSPEWIEPLNPMESLFYHTSKKRDGWGTSGTALRIADLPISYGALERAAKKVKEQHPFLQSTIKMTPPPGASQLEKLLPFVRVPSFVADPNAPEIPVEVLYTSNEHDWKQQLSDEIKSVIDPKKDPLVRFVLMVNPNGETDLLQIFHHSVTDAIGSVSLTEEFLLFYSEALKEEAGEQSAIKIAPPMAELNPDKYRRYGLQQATLGFTLRTTLINTFVLPILSTIRGIQRHPAINIVRTELSAEQTKAIVDSCRQHNTTMFGAITAAGLFACSEAFEKNVGGYQMVSVSYPISLRHRVDPPVDNQSLGVYLSTVQQNHWFNSEDAPFWEVAQKVRDDLTRTLSDKEHEQLYSLIDTVTTGLFEPERAAADKTPASLMVNNLGRVNFAADRVPFEFLGFSWASHMGENCAGLNIYAATINGKMSLTVQSERLSEVQIAELSDMVLAKISEEIQSD